MYEEYDSDNNEYSYHNFIYSKYLDLDYYNIYNDDEENNFGLDYDLTYYYSDDDWTTVVVCNSGFSLLYRPKSIFMHLLDGIISWSLLFLFGW